MNKFLTVIMCLSFIVNSMAIFLNLNDAFHYLSDAKFTQCAFHFTLVVLNTIALFITFGLYLYVLYLRYKKRLEESL